MMIVIKRSQKTCTNTLKRIRDGFVRLRRSDSSKEPRMTPDEFQQLAEDIERALYTFESTSNQAVMRVYRRSVMISSGNSAASVSDVGGENELLTQYDDSEVVFLIYL